MSSPLGKLTAAIPAIRVSEPTYEVLAREATSVGLTLQEFIRELLDIRAHGLATVKKIHDARLTAVSGLSDDC